MVVRVGIVDSGKAGIGIVLGVPRSGTTFLTGILDAMPATEAVTGNLLPTVIPHLMNQDLPDVARLALMSAFGRSLEDYLHSGAFNSRSAAFRKWAIAGGGVRSAVTGRRAVERIVYKEPFLAFAPDYVYKSLPEARLIYLVRDGRDVANSLVRTYDVLTNEKLSHLNTTEAPIGRRYQDLYVPWWVEEGREDEFTAATPYVRAIWMWTAMVGRCRRFFCDPAVVEEGRVLHIQYEDLVTDSMDCGSKIVAHLGATMTRRMRRRIEAAHRSSVGTYKNRDARELAQATRIAGDELREHGYL